MKFEIQYFPNISFFSTLKSEDLIIEKHENYQKGGLRNKCTILSANGLMNLSIPLKKGKNSKQNILDVKISYDFDWQKHHWMSIKSAYGKSAFFVDYENLIEKLVLKKYDFLFDFNLNIIENLKTPLCIPNELKFSQVFEKELFEKKEKNTFKIYNQVFSERFEFQENLSIIDLLFNMGPESNLYL